MNLFNDFTKILTFKFQRSNLLETALTHRSYLNEHKQISLSNERLEFLGDAVLELIVSFFLYEHYPDLPEGELTLLRSKIVQTKTLAKVAIKLKIPDYLKMSKGEAESGGKTNDSILADTFEALIGAIFIDQGLAKTSDFIQKQLLNCLEVILASEETTDYKSLFQEAVQGQKMTTPVYEIIAESGPDHDKTFIAIVRVDSRPFAKGTGKTKQAAQQQAAKLALEKIKRKS